MKNLINDKKAGVPIAIVLLTISIFVILGFTVFIFMLRQDKWETRISSAEQIQNIYVKSEILNFYLNRICDNLQVNSSDNPVDKFNIELARYKDENGVYVFSELFKIKFIENQIDSKHIFIEDNQVKVSFDITLGEKIFPYGAPIADYYDITYNYLFKCNKDLVKT